jgi:hypothetical protein
MKKVLVAVASMLLLTTGMAFAQDGELEIGLDYRFSGSLNGTVHDYNQLGFDALGNDVYPTTGHDVK